MASARARNRMRLLYGLYHWTDADAGTEMPIETVLERTGLGDLDALRPLAQVLEDAGLITFAAGSGMAMTLNGILVVEAAIADPTEAMPPLAPLASAMGVSVPKRPWLQRWLRRLASGVLLAVADLLQGLAHRIR